ncbi:MAG: glycoside hydrolase family 2 protein, partial [Bacteroidales bacterium]|nr:glycoside hydrolase family 2 protein [Bacteroidales bacterium]
WSFDSPNLYDVKITVLADKEVLDEKNETFGIRTFEYSVEEGAKLNGKPIVVFGGCIHHDNGILGSAAYDRAEERKVEMMKEAGFNAVRTSHNPVSEAFLNACDRLGMMVIDEAFDGWYDMKTAHDYHELIDTHWQEDISAMVLRDRNHPSIICWSIGNEIIERDRPEAVETAKKLSGLCRQLDPTRPVTEALACWNDQWIGQDLLAAQHEIVGYNYLLDLAPQDHERVPSRIIWQTESYPRDAFKNWKLINENPYIIGDFVWTAIDYLGESSIGRWYYEGEKPGEHYQGTHFPWHGAYCGDIDLTGWRKPVSYYRQLLFAPETAADIHIAVREPDGYFGKIRQTAWSVYPTWDSWNWEGWEGKPVEVEVYSKYPAVRLSLNDKIIGEQATTEENGFVAVFKVPYKPGILKAEGVGPAPITPLLCNSALCDSVATLSTAGKPFTIRLTPDRNKLKADCQ